MKFKVTKRIILANAIFWASALLIGSYYFNDTDSWSIMFIFLIGGYSIVNSFLSAQRNKQKEVKPRC